MNSFEIVKDSDIINKEAIKCYAACFAILRILDHVTDNRVAKSGSINNLLFVEKGVMEILENCDLVNDAQQEKSSALGRRLQKVRLKNARDAAIVHINQLFNEVK